MHVFNIKGLTLVSVYNLCYLLFTQSKNICILVHVHEVLNNVFIPIKTGFAASNTCLHLQAAHIYKSLSVSIC